MWQREFKIHEILRMNFPIDILIFVLIGPSPTQESRSTFDFDSIADSFCGAYGLALADMEFHQLSRIALAYLNRKKKPEVIALYLCDLKIDC